jgi:cysteine desulfurase / selenocysteine lyase
MSLADPAHYRALFPITETCAFLSHAATSPMSRPVAEAVQAHLQQAQHESPIGFFPQILDLSQQTRRQIAGLINAQTIDEIALMPNTATGINTAAQSLPLDPGDNVLVLDGDYPANIYPWMNLAYRGVLTKFVPQRAGGLDINLLEQRIDRRTRVIALSTVMFATGFRNDIAAVGRLCRERGIYFVVDAIQSLGVLPMDVQACHIDFLAAGSHKWLMATPGSGFLYCRRAILDELTPGAYVGASSVVDFFNFLDYNLTFPQSAERFHIGTINWMGVVALNAAISLLQEVGIEQVSRQVQGLIDVLINDLTERGYELAADTAPEQRSGIIVIETPDAAATCRRMNEAGVVVTPRGTGVRVAPHFYNTVEEVLRVGELLGPR